ncbi:hypothetical protein BYT27DRAFT_7226128 [Phlegmacium glaucopus]|nr:hypothetical protein BYT27DRAFT_7226128 [Phlegmacium glaucopus]
MAARILGDPWFWGRAWEKLIKFNTTCPVDPAILDFNILADWLENRETLGGASPLCYYLDMRSLESIVHGSPEILLKANLLLPECSAPKMPVVLLLEKCPGYERPVLLVLDYGQGKALLLGSSDEGQILDTPEWFQEIWTAVACFFGWDYVVSSIPIILRSWMQAGLDFGQKSAWLFHLMISGEGRSMIFLKTLNRWRLLRKECQGWWTGAIQGTIDDLEIGFMSFSWSCKACETHSGDCIPSDLMEDEEVDASERTDADTTSEQGEPADDGGVDSQQTPVAFDVGYDDYWSAPIQSQNTPPADRRIWVLQDCFRSHPTSFRTLPLDDTEEDANIYIDPFATSPQNDDCKPQNSTDGRSLVLSAQSFIDEAGPRSGTKESRQREKGTLQNPAKYLILDLERDHVSIPSPDIDISVDLDSLIWVTSLKNFKQRAGFSIHNSVYVNLGELDDPKTRLVQDVQLSRIPHLRLGFCGEGERRINFYIFFPRMMRKNQKNELWFDRVAIPSCSRAFEDAVGFSEYIPPNLAELHNRSGDRKQKHMVICEPTVGCLMEEIQLSIKDDPGLLSRFGSCFIVADGRGMKLATKQCMFSDLDWDRMLDRDRGELRHKNPLVGLWRLPRLRESFDSMGMKKGVTHHLNTLALYGGIKGEMRMKRKQETHLISRISYCLAFELVRNPGTSEYLCGDKDAVDRSKKFTGACKSWMELFSSGSTRSFGVRDEIRGLARTILRHLPSAANTWLLSDPILWIRSSTFFKFLERRFTELLLLHESCFNARLPNYRLMSLIIVHLLRHSLVTPIIKDVVVAQVLRELRFEEVMMGWGAFFLHDLDLKRMKLPAVPGEDPKSLVKAYKTPFKPDAPKEKVPPPLKLSHERVSKDYPWGEMVAQSRLIELIQTVPDQFLKTPINMPSGSLKHRDSSPIFMSFTHQIWLLLAGQFSSKAVEVPGNLKEAMDVWTLKSIQKMYGNIISVLPTQDGLIQETEKIKPRETFGNRRKIFFPTPDELEGSPLQPFTDHPTYYLFSYHHILDNQTEEQIENLNHDLDLIFSKLQCLPASMRERKKVTIWKTHAGNLEFVVNALYYRIKGISTEKESPAQRRSQLNAPAFRKKLYEKM